MDCIICIIRQLEAEKERAKDLLPQRKKQVVAINNEYKNAVADFVIRQHEKKGAEEAVIELQT